MKIYEYNLIERVSKSECDSLSLYIFTALHSINFYVHNFEKYFYKQQLDGLEFTSSHLSKLIIYCFFFSYVKFLFSCIFACENFLLHLKLHK